MTTSMLPTFIQRPIIFDLHDDSPGTVRELCHSSPGMFAIQTRYLEPTDYEGAFITAECVERKKVIQVAYDYSHSSNWGPYYVAALALLREMQDSRDTDQGNIALLGSSEQRSGWLFCFGFVDHASQSS